MKQQKMKLGPCRLLSALFNPSPTSLKRDFDSLRKSISSDRIPYHNQLSVYNLWTMRMFLRCSRIIEVQIDEYETDSDEDTENKEHLELIKRACITRSGRAVRAFVRLDL